MLTHMQLSLRYQIEKAIIIILISSLFFPPIKISNFIVNIDDLVILGFLPFIILFRSKIRVTPYLFIFFLLLISIQISIWFGYLFLDVPSTARDFNEFIRYFKYFFIIIIIGYCELDYLIARINKLLYYGSYFVITISFFQYFNILNLAKTIGELYTAGKQEHVENLIKGSNYGYRK